MTLPQATDKNIDHSITSTSLLPILVDMGRDETWKKNKLITLLIMKRPWPANQQRIRQFTQT